MKESRLSIREATQEDAERIRTLWWRTIKAAFEQESIKEFLSPEEELAFKMDQLHQAFTSPDSRYFLAFKEDEPVGTIAYGRPPNKGILKQTGGELEDMIEIGSLYIDPVFQKQGYGVELLLFILNTLLAKGVETVCFDTIIESSKQIWRRLFGEPAFHVQSKRLGFSHMIWVVDVSSSLERLEKR